MKLSSPLPHDKKARIEIIPLIDIMFFLLACFMLVSLGMVRLQSIKVNLPTSVAAERQTKKDFNTVSMDAQGHLYLDKEPMDRKALLARLQQLYAANNDVRVLIAADHGTLHGDVTAMLGMVRSSGIQKVAFQVQKDQP